LLSPRCTYVRLLPWRLGNWLTQPFFDQLESEPSSKSSGEDYQAEISFIHIAGRMASAGVVEDNLLGANYVNHFHLLKIDDQWHIISKIYIDV
jgi:hypothetical protein